MIDRETWRKLEALEFLNMDERTNWRERYVAATNAGDWDFYGREPEPPAFIVWLFVETVVDSNVMDQDGRVVQKLHYRWLHGGTINLSADALVWARHKGLDILECI